MCNPMDCPKRIQKKFYTFKDKVNVENGNNTYFFENAQNSCNHVKESEF